MRIRRLHDWEVDLSQARRIQEDLGEERIPPSVPWEEIRFVGGADVAYSRGGRRLYGVAVVTDLPSGELVESSRASLPEGFPYIPGYLSFREGPVILKAFEGIRTVPDAVIFDGQGMAHPRRLGLATHMGLFLGLPSIGCAKSCLIGEYEGLGTERGDFCVLRHAGQPIGAVLRTQRGVRPLFVSVGCGISLEAAIAIVLLASRRYRLPEPLRQAHRLACRFRDEGKAAE